MGVSVIEKIELSTVQFFICSHTHIRIFRNCLYLFGLLYFKNFADNVGGIIYNMMCSLTGVLPRAQDFWENAILFFGPSRATGTRKPCSNAARPLLRQMVLLHKLFTVALRFTCKNRIRTDGKY